MKKPLAIDLFCGLGGWTEGLLAEGYRVVGFDIERHLYPRAVAPSTESVKRPGLNWSDRSKRGSKNAQFNRPPELVLGGEWIAYPAQLVLQDVLTIHGSQFKDAQLIVASPPCQEYSYMAMPWSLAKKRQSEYESGVRDVKDLTRLFDACFRIQREACEAAGHFIPLVVENVRGAQKWVGRAAWNFGSFYLWGDVPALMPMQRAIKGDGGSWFGKYEGVKQGGDWFNASQPYIARRCSSKSKARKAASAEIAKIPFVLARHIAHVYRQSAA